jgi:hypothetical protein
MLTLPTNRLNACVGELVVTSAAVLLVTLLATRGSLAVRIHVDGMQRVAPDISCQDKADEFKRWYRHAHADIIYGSSICRSAA